MIHNRLKFTLLLLVSLWLRGRVLDWRLSQLGFDPSYGNLVCLATLMSSDRTKQICLWMTIYIYIYTHTCTQIRALWNCLKVCMHICFIFLEPMRCQLFFLDGVGEGAGTFFFKLKMLFYCSKIKRLKTFNYYNYQISVSVYLKWGGKTAIMSLFST